MPAASRTEAAPSNPGRATQSASGDRLVARCHSRGYASIAVCHMSYLLCPDTLLCAPKTQRHEQRYDRNMGRRRRRYGPDTPTRCARLHTCMGEPMRLWHSRQPMYSTKHRRDATPHGNYHITCWQLPYRSNQPGRRTRCVETVTRSATKHGSTGTLTKASTRSMMRQAS